MCKYTGIYPFRARFTKQGKLAPFKTVPVGEEISVCDLLTMRKLKNTDATSHLHINILNIPSSVQISAVANKAESGDLLTTQAQNSFSFLRH